MDEEPEELDDDAYRRAQLKRTSLIVLGIAVVLGLVVALGTMLMVRSLGLDEGDGTGTLGADQPGPPSSLPSSALPVPGQSEAPSEGPTDLVSPKATTTKRGAIQLAISPAKAKPMQRVNLTGTYQGQDNLALQVQRRQGGDWSDFPVQANVRAGTFATYVETGQTGVNQFRLYDARADKTSNVVEVTIG